MQLRTQIAKLLDGIPIDHGGGCSASKAYLMACLIRELGARASLDIGVYRGRSLFPQALAHRGFTGGIVYGVDPWSKEEAREQDNVALKPAIDRFIEATDFDAVYRDVDRLRQLAAVAGHCRLMRMTSAAAAVEFRGRGMRFGLIHVDGNHDTAVVVQDVRDFEPMLQPNGILIMDDVSWNSVRPACDILTSTMPKLFQRVDALNDYAAFWKAPAVPAAVPSWHALFSEEYVVSG